MIVQGGGPGGEPIEDGVGAVVSHRRGRTAGQDRRRHDRTDRRVAAGQIDGDGVTAPHLLIVHAGCAACPTRRHRAATSRRAHRSFGNVGASRSLAVVEREPGRSHVDRRTACRPARSRPGSWCRSRTHRSSPARRRQRRHPGSCPAHRSIDVRGVADVLVNPVATTNDSDPTPVRDAENNTPDPGGADTTTSTGPGGGASNATRTATLQIHPHLNRLRRIRRPMHSRQIHIGCGDVDVAGGVAVGGCGVAGGLDDVQGGGPGGEPIEDGVGAVVVQPMPGEPPAGSPATRPHRPSGCCWSHRR